MCEAHVLAMKRRLDKKSMPAPLPKTPRSFPTHRVRCEVDGCRDAGKHALAPELRVALGRARGHLSAARSRAQRGDIHIHHH